jgi:hypothetical protein
VVCIVYIVLSLADKVRMAFLAGRSANERERGLNREGDLLILPDASDPRPGKSF